MRFPGFIGPSYTLQSMNVDAQRCVNWYPELNEIGTGKEREVAALVGTPGLSLLATIGSGPIRGMYMASNGVLYLVSGNTLYSVDSTWTGTTVGTLGTVSGFVSMADNGIQLFAVDGSTSGYYVTLSAGVMTTIGSAQNFLGANQVTFQDGYFCFNDPNTGQFYISGLNAITFDPTQIGTAEGLPDNLLGLISDQRNLYLFGTDSVEVFYDSGDTFPFARIQGAFIPIGCMATFSIERLQGSVYWLGQDEQGAGVVYRATNYQPQRISTFALEKVLRDNFLNISSARAWTYQQDGHGFYCINIPGSQTTWVFDTSSNLWHERASITLGKFSRHWADCHAFAYNKNVVGDYSSGNIYSLEPTQYSDNGTPIPRLRASPHVSKNLVRIFHSEFQLDMETGVGLDGAGQGTDPQVVLDWSNDGGHTWSNEHWRSVGKIGTTRTRVIWRRLGWARDRIYRIRITDPIKATLIGADVGLEAGMG